MYSSCWLWNQWCRNLVAKEVEALLEKRRRQHSAQIAELQMALDKAQRAAEEAPQLYGVDRCAVCSSYSTARYCTVKMCLCHGIIHVCHGMSWYVMVCHGMSWYVNVFCGLWMTMVISFLQKSEITCIMLKPMNLNFDIFAGQGYPNCKKILWNQTWPHE